MTKRLNTHNRFSAPQDSAPSRLDELTFDHRFQEREEHNAGWRRNLSFVALAVVVVLLALFAAR